MKGPLFEHIEDLARRYLEIDIDAITAAQLSQDISTIHKTINSISNDEELQMIRSLLLTLEPHLYVARGYALDQTPRSFEFYKSIIECQEIFRQIVNAMAS